MSEYTINTEPYDVVALSQHVADGVDSDSGARVSVTTTLGVGGARITLAVEREGVRRSESVDLQTFLNDWSSTLIEEVLNA